MKIDLETADALAVHIAERGKQRHREQGRDADYENSFVIGWLTSALARVLHACPEQAKAEARDYGFAMPEQPTPPSPHV